MTPSMWTDRYGAVAVPSAPMFPTGELPLGALVHSRRRISNGRLPVPPTDLRDSPQRQEQG